MQDIYNDIQIDLSKSENKVNADQNHLNHVDKSSSSSNNLDNADSTNSDPSYDNVESVDFSKLHENTGVQPVIEISESTQVIPQNDTSIHVSLNAFCIVLLILWSFYHFYQMNSN